MRANPLPLIGGFYADETRPWSQQDICNYLPVAAESEGTRTPTIAKTPPGLSPFARISGDPSRGVYSAEDRLFTVMGNTLYQVTPTDAILLGSISGSSRVRFAHNQITGGNQVLIVNGSAGWVWNTNTSTLTLITDTGYPGAINARFIDGYLVQIEPARRFAFHSDLADALSYNTLDRFTSEVSPDLLVSMAVSNNELILFSERTAEFFENTGATQQPFRSKRISFNRGCAGRFAAIEMDNSVFWLGDDGSFYRLDGYTPLRISTRPIEQAIRGLNWDGAFAFVWKDSGHSVCYWTFPGGLTFGFDASQGKWHRRASYGFGRWRVQDMTYWQSRWIASDFQKGRLWWLDWAYPLEHDQEFISEITSPVIHDNQSRVLMPRLELVMDSGQILVEARPFEVDVAALSITGDVPSGALGDPVSGTYTVSGGVPPYGPITVLTGTFPPGLTLNTDGTYSGDYTTAGSYSWTVGGEDADGNPFSVADEATVSSGTVSLNSLTTVTPTSATVIDWSPDSIYCAITSFTSPYLHVYKRTGDTFALLTLPALGMSTRGQGLRWSPDGNELAVAPEASVSPFVLRRTGDTFTKEALSDQQPFFQERGLTYSPGGETLALSYENKLYGWSVSAGAYTPSGELAAFSASSQAMQASDYSNDGELLVTGLAASPWIDVMNVGTGYGVITPPPSAPAALAYQPRFSPDSRFLGWANSISPHYALYERDLSDNTFTAVGSLPVANAGPECFEWSPTGANFGIGGTGVDMQVFKRNGLTVTLQATLASSIGTTAIGWAPNGQYFAAGHTGGTTFVKVTE